MKQAERKYEYICPTCETSCEFDEKKEFCPECKGKMIYIGVYIKSPPRLGKIYFRRCEDCQIKFETSDDEEKIVECVQCGKPTIDWGFMWCCGRRRSSGWKAILGRFFS
ncbi:MAG: hypothetical protein WCV55_00140 [Candidatus Paceibacterota bacterium]